MNNEGAFFAFIVAMAAKGNAINPRGILPILSLPSRVISPFVGGGGGRTPRRGVACIDLSLVPVSLSGGRPHFEAISSSRSSSPSLSCQKKTHTSHSLLSLPYVEGERDKADFIPVSDAAAADLSPT